VRIPGYQILRELGRGGMATVYLALQESLNREVALKVLSPLLAQDEDYAQRFLREARIAGSLSHRHLIAILDVGRSEDGLYLAMEYVRGGNAASLRGGDPAEIVRCIREIALALAHAHANGIVHRDLKPENILRRDDGSYVLGDFGIARNLAGSQPLTGPDAVLGTPAYMSPEQWRGEAFDGRADLYALGIVFYDLLSGKVPYSGTDGWAIGMQHLNAPRPRLEVQYARWQPVLDRLLAIDPAQRYASGAELAAALAADAPVPQAATQPVALPPARKRMASRLAPIAALLGLAVLTTVALSWRNSEPPVLTAADPDKPATAVDRGTSLAVLPFRSLSSAPEDGFFADGLSEELMGTLARASSLRITGRGSAFSFKGKDIDVRDVGRQLNVAHVLEGSVQRAGDMLRINAQLSDTANGYQLWSKSFERAADDSLALQVDIARDVAKILSVGLDDGVRTNLRNGANHALYLRALGHVGEGTAAGLQQARDNLQRLTEAEPAFTPAYPRLAWAAQVLSWEGKLTAAEALAQVEAIGQRCMDAVPGHFHCRATLALARSMRTQREQSFEAWQQVHREHASLLEEAPDNTFLLRNAAFAAVEVAEFEASLRYAERAVALEPLDAGFRILHAQGLRLFDRDSESIQELHEARRLAPRVSAHHQQLASLLISRGELAEALAAGHRCVADGASGCWPTFETIFALLRQPGLYADLAPRFATNAYARRYFELVALRDREGYAALRARFDEWLASEPESAAEWHQMPVAAALDEGQAADALQLLERFQPELIAASRPALSADQCEPALLAGVALMQLDRHDEGRAMLERVLAASERFRLHRLYPLSPDVDVLALAWLDRVDEAIARLQQRVERGWSLERSMTELVEGRASALSAPLRRDPRFAPLMLQVRERNAAQAKRAREQGVLRVPSEPTR
jgi:serine/threonine protein kinase